LLCWHSVRHFIIWSSQTTCRRWWSSFHRFFQTTHFILCLDKQFAC
jgi:hypothetical protein